MNQEWINKTKLDYIRERQEEDRFLLELGNDHSVENMQRIMNKRLTCVKPDMCSINTATIKNISEGIEPLYKKEYIREVDRKII